MSTPISSLTTLANGEYIVAGLVQAIAVIKTIDGSIEKVIRCSDHNGAISKIAGLADKQTVLTISTNDHKVIAYNVFNTDIQQPKKYFEHREGIAALEVLPHQTLAATAGKDRSIKIWKLHFYKDFRSNALGKKKYTLPFN